MDTIQSSPSPSLTYSSLSLSQSIILHNLSFHCFSSAFFLFYPFNQIALDLFNFFFNSLFSFLFSFFFFPPPSISQSIIFMFIFAFLLFLHNCTLTTNLLFDAFSGSLPFSFSRIKIFFLFFYKIRFFFVVLWLIYCFFQMQLPQIFFYCV